MGEVAFTLGAVTYKSGKIFMEETELELSLKEWIGFGDWDRRQGIIGVGICKDE